MSKLYSDTFRWLAIGLLVTFVSGFAMAQTPQFMTAVLGSGLGYLLPIFVQFGICIVFGLVLKKLSYQACVILYLVYSLLTGIDIAILLHMFYLSSIITIFLATSFVFGMMAFLGKYLDVDVTKLGTILFISLIGVILMSVVNILVFQSSNFNLLMSCVAIVIFLGYIIFDLKILEPLSREVGEDKAAVYCAFQLYLDFINLFIRLLQIFGKRRD